MNAHVIPPKKILVATDLSETSAAALRYAREIKDRFGATLHVMHAQYIDMPAYFSSGQMEPLARELRLLRLQAANHLRNEVRQLLGDLPEVLIVERPPAEATLETADKIGADLIIMGTHGRTGARRLWLGSVAEQVLRLSHRPVLAVPSVSNLAIPRHILCPFAPTASGYAAIDYAVRITREFNSALTVIHAAEPGSTPLECPLVAEPLRGQCRMEEVVRPGDAGSVIIGAVQEKKPDLIVIGSDRRQSALGLFFSSTTQKVMQAATVPILVVPRSGTEAAG